VPSGRKRARLASLQPRLAILDVRTATRGPKTVDPFYMSPEWCGLIAERCHESVNGTTRKCQFALRISAHRSNSDIT